MKTINKIFIGAGIVAVSLYIFLTLLPLITLEPLHFSIYNRDVNKHEVTIEIFDSNNNSLFKETFELGPKEAIHSPKITKRKGEYTFKVILDMEITVTYKAKVDIGRGAVHIMLYNRVMGKIVPIWISQTV